jgi:hypothetical protein
MSSLMPSLATHYKKSNPYKKLATIGLTLALATATLITTGCNTTQEFKPTASVIVGAHTSL